MILSDGSLRQRILEGSIVVDPYVPANVQPASIDVTLADTFLVFSNHAAAVIDPSRDTTGLTSQVVVDGSGFVLHPGEFVLASTVERLTLPTDVVSRVEGKSSLGRLGLLIHATAGFVDPGWTDGQITLELSNVATLPIVLRPGMKIGQLSFHLLDRPAEHPYGHPSLNSKYVHQTGPVASQYHRN